MSVGLWVSRFQVLGYMVGLFRVCICLYNSLFVAVFRVLAAWELFTV